VNHYKVLEVSYINGALQPVGAIVQINDDPDNGGMTPAGNLAACDEEGNIVKPKAARKGKAASADDIS
jgi:hypothetical protein